MGQGLFEIPLGDVCRKLWMVGQRLRGSRDQLWGGPWRSLILPTFNVSLVGSSIGTVRLLMPAGGKRPESQANVIECAKARPTLRRNLCISMRQPLLGYGGVPASVQGLDFRTYKLQGQLFEAQRHQTAVTTVTTEQQTVVRMGQGGGKDLPKGGDRPTP